MITVQYRLVAGVSGLLAGVLAVGAKAATILLVLWTTTVLLGARLSRDSQTKFWAEILRPSRPVYATAVFAVYAGVSALWAHDPRAALAACVSLLSVLLCGKVLHSALEALPAKVAVLVSGWFVIGLLCGTVVLLYELRSDFGLLRWVLAHVPSVAPVHSSMLALQRGTWVLLNRSLANWSVAGINLLLWPALLIVCSIMRGRSIAIMVKVDL